MDPDQQAILDVINEGKSVFISGGGGTGKTHLIRYIRQENIDECVACAPTWVAAHLFGGESLNKALKIAPTVTYKMIYADNGEIDPDWAEQELKPRGIKKIKMLILDEISMISGDMLMIIDKKLQIINKSSARFGGAQVIASGDFAQLTPIPKVVKYQYAFEAPCWIFNKTLYPLRVPHRQRAEDMVNALNNIRYGGDYSFFEPRVTSPEKIAQIEKDNPDIIKIAPHRATCDAINRKMLAKLPGTSFGFRAIDISSSGNIVKTAESSNFSTSHLLVLKRNAKMLLIKSLEPKRTFYNGKILYIDKFEKFNCVENQPMGEDAIPNKIYATCLYDALSPESKATLKFYNQSRNRHVFDRLLEKFTPENKINLYSVTGRLSDGTLRVIRPYADIIDSKGFIVALRIQLPILLGYAITYHRGQGLEFDSTMLYLGGVFDPCMPYMGLSRCRTFDKLFIIGQLPDKNLTDQKLIRFIRKVEKGEEEEIDPELLKLPTLSEELVHNFFASPVLGLNVS